MGPVAELSINVLGPMEVLADGTAVDLPSRRQRALLAALVVHHGRPVSVTELIDAVPSPTAGSRRASSSSRGSI